MTKPFSSKRPLMSQATLAAGMALTLGSPVLAQTAPQAPGETIVLDTVTLEGAGTADAVRNTNRATTGIARLPGTVQGTPRVVNGMPRQVLDDQKVTTVEQALRNVPGIALGSGEGNGGQNGDGFRSSLFKLIGRLEEGKVAPGLTFHGIQHTIGALPKEDDASEENIAIALGQKTIAMARHCSQEANHRIRMPAATLAFDPIKKNNAVA